MVKCANTACKIERRTHLWIVGGMVYCSPWCERNRGSHPNTVGNYKNLWRSIKRS